MTKFLSCLSLLALLIGLGVVVSPVVASTLYLAPGSGSVGQGKTISVQVRLNSGGEAVNAVSAYLAYPQDKLEVTQIDDSGSAFLITAENAADQGLIKLAQGNIEPVEGDVRVATIEFKGKETGKADLVFTVGSAVPRANDSTDSLNLAEREGGLIEVIAGDGLASIDWWGVALYLFSPHPLDPTPQGTVDFYSQSLSLILALTGAGKELP